MLQRAFPELRSEPAGRLAKLDAVSTEHADAPALVRYARTFACLCAFLHQEQPKHAAAPLRFRFAAHPSHAGKTHSDSYWLHLPYVCVLAARETQAFCMRQINFGGMLNACRVSSHNISPATLSPMLSLLRDCIGVVSWLLRVGRGCSIWIDSVCGDALRQCEASLHQLRVWALWLLGGQLETRALDPSFDHDPELAKTKMFYSTAKEIAEQHDLLTLPDCETMQAIHRDCVRRVLLTCAAYAETVEIAVGAASACYLAAHKLDWPYSNEALRTIDLNAKHWHFALPPDDALDALPPHAPANLTLFSEGNTPLNDCVFSAPAVGSSTASTPAPQPGEH